MRVPVPRPRWLRRRVRAALAALFCLPLLAAIALASPAHALTPARSSTTTTAVAKAATTAAKTTTAACTVSAILVPSCGAWWGMS
ncbi:MAG: hypothetical protein ABI890_11515, partial [Lapillicoccus sp.]